MPPTSSAAPLFVTGFPGSGLRLLESIARAARGGPEVPGPIDQPSPAAAFRAIEEALLHTAGLDWDRLPGTEAEEAAFRSSLDARGGGILPSGVFSSPTLVVTWPFWLNANPRARLLVALRHPAEAMAALRGRREVMNPEAAVELWRAYARLIHPALDDPRTVVVHFDSMLDQPHAGIAGITDAHPGSLPLDRARRTRRAGESAVPAECASAYATLCARASPGLAALRKEAGFEARKEAHARSAAEVLRWRAAERNVRDERRAEVDRAALDEARLRARAAEERLADLEGSLVFKTARLAWSVRDSVFPPGTRRRSLQRWLRLRLAGAIEASGLLERRVAEGLEADDREYALHLRRTVVPGVDRPLPPLRIIAVDDTSPLKAATADSVLAQSHQGWTFQVAAQTHDGPNALAALDPRIAIAPPSTDAFAQLAAMVSDLADEDIVVLLRNGTMLHPLALSNLVEAVRSERAEAGYCDLDHLDGRGARVRPWFKPDWSPDLTLSVDLLGPVAAIRARGLKGPVLRGVPPALWHWRLALHLRASGARVAHVGHVLAHVPEDARPDRAGAAEMIGESLRAEGRAEVRVSDEGRLRVEWRPAPELVSIVIPTKDKAQILGVCLETLLGRTRHRPFEVILVDTGSGERATERLYDSYRNRSGFSIVRDHGPFNFSRACNTGARFARGSRLLFLNNDTEILDEDWLDRMSQWLDDPGVGAVGARLLYPDATLQHAGVVVGMGGLASHLFHQQPLEVCGIFGPESWYRDLSAVTAACLLTSGKAFASVGGFDETLELVYGDTDYCLRLRQIGLRIVYSPDAELVHHESQSRGRKVPRADFLRFSDKLRSMGILHGDPYFNPNLSYRSTRPRIRVGPFDNPAYLNRQFISSLPSKPTIIVPDDLT